MNQRIRSVFWLITLCIIGINAWQGYWLWTTYQLNRQQFSPAIQEWHDGRISVHSELGKGSKFGLTV